MADPLASISLNALRVFEAAARQRSFTRAADELGITQAAVSWQVRALERRLGQVLFDRLPREVTLTDPGARLAGAATQAMGILRTAVSDLAETGRTVLAITSTGSLATHWLAPRLAWFQLAHPQIAVRMEADARMVDLARENIDVALRSGSGVWPDQESIFLFPATLTPLCTPAFAHRHGGLKAPRDLLEAPQIGLDEDWSTWFAAAGVNEPGGGRSRLIAKQQAFEVASALAGRVVALGSPMLFATEIAQGRLVQPFETMMHLSAGYWLTYRKERRREAKIVAFREWLLAEIANDPAAAARAHN